MEILEAPQTTEVVRSGCEFCHGDELGENSTFFKLHGLEQTLWKNQSTRVVMDTYPITQGHIMLITNEHFMSSAEAFNQKNIKNDLEGAVNWMSHIYEGYPLIIFEHGSGVQGQEKVHGCGRLCGPSNDHAHIHIMPAMNPRTKEIISISMDEIQPEAEFLLEKKGWEDMRHPDKYQESTSLLGSRQNVGEKPYIQIGILQPDHSYQEITYMQSNIDEEMPSQLMRRTLAAKLLGRPALTGEWDYHDLEWRIFVDGFKSDVPRLSKMIHDFHQRQTFLMDIYSK